MLGILKNNKLTNSVYESLIEESHKLFSKFSDDDFFSDKVQHIYFYSGINDESVNQLQKLLFEASQTKMNQAGIQISPKPIVLHLKSGGGQVSSADIFYSIIQYIRVPLCVLIENLCASAATDLGLLAPYKVMIDYSNYMIHDGAGVTYSKMSNMVKGQMGYYYSFTQYENLLKKRTKLKDDEIKVFIERDILLDAEYCLKKGIIDRILPIPKINKPDFYTNSSDLQLNLTTFLKKTNLNHIYMDDKIYDEKDLIVNGNKFNNYLSDISEINELCIFLDNNFLIKKDNVKPIIIHFKPRDIIAIMSQSNPLALIELNFRLALVQKKIPIIAFIEGSNYFDLLSSIMMCPIRIMMKPTIIQSTFTFRFDRFGWKTIDLIDNSIFIFENTVKFLKQNSNLPDNFYKEMRNRILNLTPKELLKYNIIHLCLNLNQNEINKKKYLIKYLQLNNLVGFKNNNKNLVKKTK